jgi:hypothetical protein
MLLLQFFIYTTKILKIVVVVIIVVFENTSLYKDGLGLRYASHN